MIRLFLLFLAAALNQQHDTPHEPESRPDFAEYCFYTATADPTSAVVEQWVEIAGPTSAVCDRTGVIIEVESLNQNETVDVVLSIRVPGRPTAATVHVARHPRQPKTRKTHKTRVAR